MATTQKTTTTTRKEWQPNDKQKMFIETLKALGTATFREIKKFILENYGETIATGSVNVLTTKQYVGSKEVEFEIQTTTTYRYPNGDIVETKNSTKKEKVYFLIAESDRETFEQANAKEKTYKKSIPAEDTDFDDDDLVDIGE